MKADKLEAGVGVLALGFTGVLNAVEMVGSRVLQDQGWPYWPTTACAYVLSCCVVLLYCCARKIPRPTRRHLKWLMLRGFFGASFWGLAIIAVQVGAAPGDVGALMSVNVVAAAFLGRFFLGERLRLASVAAVVCAVGGALLISQPSFIFGGTDSSPWFGHVLAIVAGISNTGAFLTSRHLADVNVNWVNLFAMGACVFLCVALPLLRAVSEAPLQVMVDSPAESLGWVGASFALTIVPSTLACIGGMLCPVAMSATVYMASNMLIGYLAQIAVFRIAPGPFTIGGAVCMLAAVTLMACARAPKKDQDKDESAAVEEMPEELPAATDGTESVTSFVFSELCDFHPASERSMQRRSRRLSQGGSDFSPSFSLSSLRSSPPGSVLGIHSIGRGRFRSEDSIPEDASITGSHSVNRSRTDSGSNSMSNSGRSRLGTGSSSIAGRSHADTSGSGTSGHTAAVSTPSRSRLETDTSIPEDSAI